MLQDDIEKLTLENKNFRTVVYAGRHTQLTLMRLPSGEDIGWESHGDLDQFFRIEPGQARVDFERTLVIAIGMIAEVVEPQDLESRVATLAEQVAHGPPLAQHFLKVAMSRSLDLTFEQAVEHEDEMQAVLSASQDLREEVAAFTERRDPDFEGR